MSGRTIRLLLPCEPAAGRIGLAPPRFCPYKINNSGRSDAAVRQRQSGRKGGRKVKFTFVLALVIVVLTAFFSLQNAQTVRVAFFAWEREASLVLVLLVTFAAGVLAGWLAAIPAVWRRSRTIGQLRREMRKSPPGSPDPH